MKIQKYQSPANGIVQQDNTYVTKPIEQRLIKRTYKPKQTYLSQDNRTRLQHKQAQKKADEAYSQQIKDKKTAEALNHLYGFSNFADIVGLGVGAGSLAKFGIKQGIKSLLRKLLIRRLELLLYSFNRKESLFLNQIGLLRHGLKMLVNGKIIHRQMLML